MEANIHFEELGKGEQILLLQAFDYDVDNEGYILNQIGKRIISEENPSEHLHISTAALIPGSLKPVDGTPTSIAKLIRKKVENKDDSRS